MASKRPRKKRKRGATATVHHPRYITERIDRYQQRREALEAPAQSGCERKLAYATKAEAHGAQSRYAPHASERVAAYHCRACGAYHLGRKVVSTPQEDIPL